MIQNLTPEMRISHLLTMLKGPKSQDKQTALRDLMEVYFKTEDHQALSGIYMAQFDSDPEVSKVAEKIMTQVLEKDGDLLESVNQRIRERVINHEMNYLMDPYVINGILKAKKQEDRIKILINIYKNIKRSISQDIESIPSHQTLSKKEKGLFEDCLKFHLSEYTQRIESLRTNSIMRLHSFERTLQVMDLLRKNLKDHRTKQFKHLNDLERSERIKTIDQMIKTIETLMVGRSGHGEIDKLLSLERLKKQHQKRLDKRSKFLRKKGEDPQADLRCQELMREIDGVDDQIQKQQIRIDQKLKEHRTKSLICRTYKPL